MTTSREEIAKPLTDAELANVRKFIAVGFSVPNDDARRFLATIDSQQRSLDRVAALCDAKVYYGGGLGKCARRFVSVDKLRAALAAPDSAPHSQPEETK